MIDALLKTLEQMPSRPFRVVLLKSAGLAVILLIAIGVGLDRALTVLIDRAGQGLDALTWAHLPLKILDWLLAITAGLGIVAAGVLLMPVVTAIVAGFFVDEIADRVEARYYPGDPPGRPLPAWAAIIVGARSALLSLAVYACAVPFLFVAGLGFVIFFLATAYVQGRVFFELSAMRFHPIAQAKALRRRHSAGVFAAGLIIAAFLSIPIVSLAAPLFGTALMVHLYKRWIGRGEVVERGAGVPAPRDI
jgi:CysZ protein